MKCRPVRLALLVLGIAATAPAQAPNDAWRTISAPHVRVHFPRGADSLARRAAGEAERAWAALAAELVPPRGPIDVIMTDNEDVSNGSATVFPSNRIVILMRPPVDEPALRVGDDWLRFVITHELAHLFHLDRSRGWWRVAQRVFGRHPALFPHLQSPRWLSEGIAVELESRLGSGRLNGSQLSATLGALDAHGRRATPQSSSIAAPRFPAGNTAYFGGARMIATGMQVGGDSALRWFIEEGAAVLLPLTWDRVARRAFGASFGDLAQRATSPAPAALPTDARAIGAPWWEARAPRWRGDTLRFVAAAPRHIPAVWDAVGSQLIERARRNSVDAHGQSGAYAVYAELDLTDPWRLRSALVVDERPLREGDDGAASRESSPDVRADGRIVAVRTVPGTTILVLHSADGRAARVLTPPSIDEQWSAPRWSRRGDRIAAVRWRRGGETEIVVLDTLGRALGAYARTRAVQQHPSWDVDDAGLYFASDREGRMAVHRVALATGEVRRVLSGAAGLFDPEVSADGQHLAVFALDADGYQLVVVPTPRVSEPAVAARPAVASGEVLVAGGASRVYAPWRSLVPRYWIPSLALSSRGDDLLGIFTTGRDLTGRHEIGLQALWDTRRSEFTGAASWQYAGFGVPLLRAGVEQSWDAFRIVDTAQRSRGELARRNRVATVTVTWQRPRVRTGAYLTTGLETEWREFASTPVALRDSLDPLFARTLVFPGAVVAAGWNNVRRAPLAVSAEDGVALSVVGRRRWRTDAPAATDANSVLGDLRAYRSLPLPGHARHVLALRGAGGVGDRTMARPFAAGGVSGSTLDVLPGVSVGDAQRSFGVRGFAPATLSGVQAWGASAEYRAPLPLVGRGLWPLPFFWQRSAVVVYGDAASAWCPPGAPSIGCPAGGTARTTIASAGAELLLDVAVDYDAPTRFRLGGALPLQGGVRRLQGYASLGVQF